MTHLSDDPPDALSHQKALDGQAKQARLTPMSNLETIRAELESAYQSKPFKTTDVRCHCTTHPAILNACAALYGCSPSAVSPQIIGAVFHQYRFELGIDRVRVGKNRQRAWQIVRAPREYPVQPSDRPSAATLEDTVAEHAARLTALELAMASLTKGPTQ